MLDKYRFVWYSYTILTDKEPMETVYILDSLGSFLMTVGLKDAHFFELSRRGCIRTDDYLVQGKQVLVMDVESLEDFIAEAA